MRIRKRQVPLPLSSLLPVPLSDLYFNLSPTATERYFRGGFKDRDCGFPSLQLPPPSDIADRQIQRDLKKEKEKALDDDNGDVDVKSRTDASGSSKNVNNPGESISPTQVSEKNEKFTTLRKRRSFINFEDYEYEEEEEEEEEESTSGGSSKGKKKGKKSSSGGALEEGSRCSRVNGRGWRCCQQTLVGYSLCEHHLGKGRVRNMNKSGGGRGGEKKAVVEVNKKKKKAKLGMVKARLMSSLLGQTSTSSSGNNAEVIGATESDEISASADQVSGNDK